jgi:hypothetical protein
MKPDHTSGSSMPTRNDFRCAIARSMPWFRPQCCNWFRSGLGVALLPMIGRLPYGLCPAEGLPPANNASILVRGRAGVDPDVLSTVDAAVRDVLAAEN